MTTAELKKLMVSNEAPSYHDEYTIWLHNKILEKVLHDIWQFREKECMKIKSPYAVCNNIMLLPSLQTVK